jgi:hypothetical protein
MKLHDIFHASTRPAWTARLVVYLAAIATLSITAQVIGWLW